jgi:hypothetical protein
VEKITQPEIQTYLERFTLSGETTVDTFDFGGESFPVFINEFWTAKQRQASSIHEISYRACFKPQLPRFFIQLLSKEKDVVYDPFAGRGTTIIEAALLKRFGVSNDVNPLSEILARPRLAIPKMNDIRQRLHHIPMDKSAKAEMDLSMFYHPDTETELVSLRHYLQERREAGTEDDIDRWIRMVATNRLTGHSKGFFSVYTLPPNQAVSPESQIKINKKRNQIPDYRNTQVRIIRKTKSLLRNVTSQQLRLLNTIGKEGRFLTEDARETTQIPLETIQITITSPPFLDIVQYSQDNWLRCWFNSLDDAAISEKITMAKTVEEWSTVMADVFHELFRITKAGGWVAFEVGEVRRGKIKLEEYIVPIGVNAGFRCEGIIINLQDFTKTSNIWGIDNNAFGTNTNRIVLFKK